MTDWLHLVYAELLIHSVTVLLYYLLFCFIPVLSDTIFRNGTRFVSWSISWEAFESHVPPGFKVKRLVKHLHVFKFGIAILGHCIEKPPSSCKTYMHLYQLYLSSGWANSPRTVEIRWYIIRWEGYWQCSVSYFVAADFHHLITFFSVSFQFKHTVFSLQQIVLLSRFYLFFKSALSTTFRAFLWLVKHTNARFVLS